MLHIHRAERADRLVWMLGDLLSEPLCDVMTAEVVSVPTRGIERWLTQQLSGRLGASAGRYDGICANVDFPFPGTLVGRALASASGIDPDTDPWTAERSVWTLLQVVESNLDQGWLSPFATHLKKAAPDGEHRRLASVRHVAELFDRYSVHRPDMVRQWAGGSNGGVRPDAVWQPRLWRELRERIAVPSPAERLPEACTTLRSDLAVPGLPERISLFGLTSLPASYVDVVFALANLRDVHLFLLHPSYEMWNRICQVEPPPRGLKRKDDPTVSEAHNPLLSSWGRDSREMQLVLLAEAEGTWADVHSPVDSRPATLLEHVQDAVRRNEKTVGAPTRGGVDDRVVVDATDRSIQIHACHGRARQVEVLRHAILHLFQENQDLEPRDVLVMCPDIETYAPLIHAVFDSQNDKSTESDPDYPNLKVRLADRAIRQVNPLFAVVSRLLDMAGGRVTATEVLDLASTPPVRRMFGFDDDDLAKITNWVISSGIRWGIDSQHRSPFHLQKLASNTWDAGIARVLVGVSMAEDSEHLFGGVLPLDDVGSGSIELAGRMAELIDRLTSAVDQLSRSQSVSMWAKSISTSVYGIARAAASEDWQSVQLDQVLSDLVNEATLDGVACETDLSLGDVRAVLEDRLKGRPTRANFRTGHLTVCTLVPMRSVPHRVVCLLGLDDGAFPRSPERDGDDLVLADPRVGDHDARSEDRQLILDALLAAREHLVITYTGRDERSNLPRPPAVPVGELLDVINATAVMPEGTNATDHVIVHHPLQPFDYRNFMKGVLSVDGAWSFDRVNLDGAVAAASRALTQPKRRQILAQPLAPVEDKTVELRDLEAFLRSPVRAFLKQRLGINIDSREDDVDDALPVDLDALEQWGVGDRIVQAMLAGSDLESCIAAERARGTLPPGLLSEPILEKMKPEIAGLVRAASDDRQPTSVGVNLQLPSGIHVVGTVPGLTDEVLKNVTYSRMSPSLRLQSWLRLLALVVSDPDRPLEAVTYARSRKDRTDSQDEPGGPDFSSSRIRVFASDSLSADERRVAAELALGSIVDLYLRGMREPAPLYCKTSAAWAAARLKDREPAFASNKEWTTTGQIENEDAKPEHVIVFGGTASFEEICEPTPAEDESGPEWDTSERSRLGRWARRLWDPLLSVEELRQ